MKKNNKKSYWKKRNK